MLHQFSLDDLIPIFTIGALLITALYHSNLYYFNRTKLLGYYSIYLWICLLFVLQATITVDDRISNKPTIPYLICSFTLWFAFWIYLRFMMATVNFDNLKESPIYKLVTRFWIVIISYHSINALSHYKPNWINELNTLLLIYSFIILTFVVYILIFISKLKKDYTNMCITSGSAIMIFFLIFAAISTFLHELLFNLTSLSFICAAFFFQIIPFSLIISYKIKLDEEEKSMVLNHSKQQKLQLEIERNKASNILLQHDIKIKIESNQAALEQRQLIGRKLHDDLSGSLVALKYLIEDKLRKSASTGEAATLIDIEQEVKSIYEETRAYSHQLSEKEIEKEINSYNINDYLLSMKSRLEKLNLFVITINFNENEVAEFLRPEISEQIYFLIKESLSNVIKHAEAKEIMISISFQRNSCIIEIKDDGKGFDTSDHSKGLGIKNTISGIRNINGAINIYSNNQGTSIVATIPIKEKCDLIGGKIA